MIYCLPCADPESFDRGGPTFFYLFFIRGKRIQIALKAGPIGPPAKRHLNGVSLAGH